MMTHSVRGPQLQRQFVYSRMSRAGETTGGPAATSLSKTVAAMAGQVALLALLMGCASTGTDNPIFDYAASASEAAVATPVKTVGKTEKPKVKSASALLGTYQTGPGYTVQPDVTSDGRYNTYMFATDYGTYPVTGDELARRHIQELTVLSTLKKYSKAREFAGGVGNAVASPVKAVANTVTDPVGTAKGTYANVERKVESLQRGMSEAGEFIVTFGHPEKKRPDREDDNLLKKLVGTPEAKRRLARALMVDPYTHFVPLAKELDKVASYSAAGGFAIDRAVGFVPGAAGIVISSLQTLDSLTKQTLDMDPKETAAINRERLEKLEVPKDTIKKLLLNDRLTPTEKTLVVGYLDAMAGQSERDAFASLVATSETRHDAVVSFLTLSYLSARPFGDDPISSIEIIDRVPVLTLGDGRRIVVFTADDLAWTPSNSDQLSKLGNVLKGNGKRGAKKEIRISGNASPLAERELQRQGWIVKSNSFDILRQPSAL